MLRAFFMLPLLEAEAKERQRAAGATQFSRRNNTEANLLPT